MDKIATRTSCAVSMLLIQASAGATMILGSAMKRLKEIGTSTPEESKPKEPIQLLIEQLQENFFHSLGVELVYVVNLAEAKRGIEHLIKCEGLFGLDIETYPLSSHAKDKSAGIDPKKSRIRLIQIFDGTNRVYIFDVLKLGGLTPVMGAIWQKPMVAHNAMFELKHLVHAGIAPQKLGCSLLADRVIHGSRSKLKETSGLSKSAGLKDLAKEMLKMDISKEMQTSDWSQEYLTAEQIEYAALDAILPVHIFKKQQEALKAHRLNRAYEILRDAQFAVAHMELCGIGFDVDKHQALIEEWEAENNRLRNEIFTVIGKELNLNSTKQVGEWLQEALEVKDLEGWVRTSGGKLSTSTPTFKLKEHLHAIFPTIVAYRQVAKKIHSFGKSLYKFIDIPAKRLYGSFSLGTTSTGRMASHKPNMQNMPRTGFRDLFTAQEGYVLIGLDYSQQELRVAALIAEDQELLKIYAEGGDVHVNTAASLLNLPREAITKTQRQLAKAVAFGLLYGQGAKGLALYAKQQYGVEMTEKEAEQHRTAFFKTYPGLQRWQRETGHFVKVTGIARTQCGRIRDFNKEQEGYRFNAALNLPIQGTAAEITLRALARLTPVLCQAIRLVNVVHDEILLETLETHVKEAADKATEAMEAAFLDVFPSAQPYLKGVVEAKSGNNWNIVK